MHLSISKICQFGKCTISSRNYVKGEKLLNANHILKCERMLEMVNSIYIRAYCL